MPSDREFLWPSSSTYLVSTTDNTLNSIFVGSPWVIASCALLATDPESAMKKQQMDWHYLMFIAVWFAHSQRTTLQLIRVRRVQKFAEKNFTLLDILADPRGSLLFEKHLIGGQLLG
jgi:hypothetical protein